MPERAVSAAPVDDLAVDDAALLDLEAKVQRALATGDEAGLDVMGYGEVTVILRLPVRDGSLACKRLPVFSSLDRFERYRDLLGEYIDGLLAAGVDVAPSRLWHHQRRDRRVVAYCLQRALPGAGVGNRHLAHASAASAEAWFDGVLAAASRAITPSIGLDVQASNWVSDGDRLIYIDVTTPFLRDARGRERLDVKLFMSSLPWALREPVRLILSKSIFDKFYTPRGAVLDLLGNLHKEKLERLVPGFLRQANQVLGEPITEAQVLAYYQEDARMWTLIQGLRRADRWWQRRVRRRAYPFLLPGAIER